MLYAGKSDNQYLHTDIDGSRSFEGCLFVLNCEHADFSDIHTTVYGHNMRNGDMFGSLKKYQESGFYEQNRYFTYYTPERAYRFLIFSEFVTDEDSEVYTYGYAAGTDEYLTYIRKLQAEGPLTEEIVWTGKEKTMTLSTCTAQGDHKRYTIHAVCVDTSDINSSVE